MEKGVSLFWGIVLAGIGAYTMRASFVVLLSGVTFPDRVIRILDHVGPAVMAALVVTTLTGSDGRLEAGPIEFLTLAVMAGVTLWRNDLLIGLFTALVVFFTSNSLFG
jgi:branched-subunit amino acid transport protein